MITVDQTIDMSESVLSSVLTMDGDVDSWDVQFINSLIDRVGNKLED